MELTEKDVKRASLVIIVLALAVLAYLVVRPILMSIVGGLILAFVFFPVYRRLMKLIRSKNLAASIVSIFVILIIVIPLWFLVPLLAKRIFELFQLSQTIDFFKILKIILPTASDQLITQLSITASSATGKISSAVLNSLVDFIIDFPTWSLHLLIVAFVFFFALRDSEQLNQFVSGLSPLNKNQEKNLVKEFQNITNSIIYGQIVIGIIQGLFAGLGFLIFGVPNAFVLTLISILLGVIPIVGPPIIYIPIGIYMLISGDASLAFLYLAYNIVFVSTIEHGLRTMIVSKRAAVSQVTVIIGMIGGLFVFGVLGLILGPLILSYFITFLKAYKEKTLSSLFAEG